MIDAMYTALMQRIVPKDVIERIQGITDKEWYKFERDNIDSIYEYLEQFRFRPTRGTIYNNYTSPEDTELLGLIAKTEPTIRMYREGKKKVKLTFVD